MLSSSNWGRFLTACAGFLAHANCTTVLLTGGAEARLDRRRNANDVTRGLLSTSTARRVVLTLDLLERAWLPAATLANVCSATSTSSNVVVVDDDAVSETPAHCLDAITDQLLRLRRVVTAVGTATWRAQTLRRRLHRRLSSTASAAAATTHRNPRCLSCPATPRTKGSAKLQRRKSSDVQKARTSVAQHSTPLAAQNFHAARATHPLALDHSCPGCVGETTAASAFCPCLLTDSVDARGNLCNLSSRTADLKEKWALTFLAAADPDGAASRHGFTLTKSQADRQLEFHCICGRVFDSEVGGEIHLANTGDDTLRFTPPSETDQIGGGRRFTPRLRSLLEPAASSWCQEVSPPAHSVRRTPR